MTSNPLSRRQFLQLSAVAGGALALSACVPAAAPAGDAAAAAVVPAVVTYWYGWGNLDPAMAKIVETEEFKKHMNGATLEYKGSVNDEAMLTSIAGGNPPDCHSNHDYPNYFARGAAIPVQDMAAASSIVKKENLLDWVWDYSFFDGQMIGVPGIESYTQYGLNVNSDLATKAELDVKSLPRTWAETMEWHKKLTKKDDAGNLIQMGLDPHDAMGGDMDFQPLSYGVTWYDEKTKEFHLDDERIVEMINTTAEFIRFAGPDQFAGMRQVQGNGGWGDAVEAGIQAMIIEGYWHPGEAQIHKPEIAKFNVAHQALKRNRYSGHVNCPFNLYSVSSYLLEQ